MNAFKTFDKFEDGIKETMSISKTITDIITKNKAGEDTELDYQTIVEGLLFYIKGHIPTIDSEEYPNTPAISVSANEVGVKLPGQLAFGWRCNLKEDNTINYDFRITVNTSAYFAKKNPVLIEAKNKGWKIVAPKKKNFNNKKGGYTKGIGVINENKYNSADSSMTDTSSITAN